MTFDERVEMVAETLWQSEYARATGKRRSIQWGEVSDETQEQYRFCARATLAALETWHLIGTAPTDGTDILLLSWVLHEAPGGPIPEMVVASWDVEDCGGEGGWILGDYERPLETKPTHWMPLPAPPTVITAGQRGEP